MPKSTGVFIHVSDALGRSSTREFIPAHAEKHPAKIAIACLKFAVGKALECRT